MAKCPNRKRKRPGPGGGTPGCDGDLEMIVTVPLSLGCRRPPKGLEGMLDVLHAKHRHGGRMVSSADIRGAIGAGNCDIRCRTCGWSYKSLMIAPRKRRR